MNHSTQLSGGATLTVDDPETISVIAEAARRAAEL
jgi:hypothetical protein